MIYPFEDGENEIQEEESVYIPREYGINFETAQLTGKVVEGLEAVKVWAWLALQTARERYYIYTTDYGQEYEDMIGGGYTNDYLKAELKRMTVDCLAVNPFITGVENFEMSKDGDHVTLSFLMVTNLGDAEVNTNV